MVFATSEFSYLPKNTSYRNQKILGIRESISDTLMHLYPPRFQIVFANEYRI